MWPSITTALLISVVTFGLFQKPYANDPCGDPTMESNVWAPVDGTVVEVIDGDELALMHKGQRWLVDLVGLETPALDQPFGRDAQALLERLVKNQKVTVWVSTSDWWNEKSRPTKLLGVVYLPEQKMRDVNLELITAGFARWKKPPPYKMSGYSSCKHYYAEKQAQAAKRGLWAQGN